MRGPKLNHRYVYRYIYNVQRGTGTASPADSIADCILKIRPESFDRNNQIFNKVDNSQVFNNIVIVETDATLEEIQRVKGGHFRS